LGGAALFSAIMDASQSGAVVRLETRLAYLERHVEEQDREIYRQAELIRRLVRESEKLRERVEDMEDGDGSAGSERPPHY